MQFSLLGIVVLVGLVAVSQAATPTECSTYCAYYQSICPTFYATYYPTVDNTPSCPIQCSAFPDGTSQTGDTYQCRLAQTLTANRTGNLDTYCPNALPTGGNVCGTALNNYCDKMMMVCIGEYAEFVNYTSCMLEAQFYPTNGVANAQTGDSLQCRSNLATGAIEVPSLYCDGAGPFADDGGSTSCGTACQNYCDHYMITCTIANAGNVYQYANYTDCQNQCATWTKLALNYLVPTTGGNSFNCRSYHVLVAGTNAGNVPGTQLTYPEYHCPHAGPSGGGVCVGSPPVSSTGSSSTGSSSTGSSSTGSTGSAVALLPSSFLVVSLIFLTFQL